MSAEHSGANLQLDPEHSPYLFLSSYFHKDFNAVLADLKQALGEATASSWPTVLRRRPAIGGHCKLATPAVQIIRRLRPLFGLMPAP